MRGVWAILAVIGSVAVSAQSHDTTQFEIQADNPVLYQLDQLDMQNWAANDPTLQPIPARDSLVYPSEEVIEQRLIELDKQSPLDLSYNKTVSSYIKMYVQRRRELSAKILGKSEEFFPLFEQVFDNQEIPLEIKYLAVVESALNPVARSRVGATGLWQFMLYTGKQYGLEVNSYMDERRDPYLSTVAAGKYLTHLHGLYDDWNLALAAYNCGPGNVNKAIRRSGGHRDYWKIYRWLPRETRGYVPAFVAVNYMMAYADEHHLYPAEPRYRAYELDTLRICYAVSFDRVSEFAGVDREELTYLNPMYKAGFIPDPDQPVVITLPRKKIGAYLANEESICYYRTDKELARAVAVEEPQRVVHVVRRGQSLGLIAQRHGVSVRSIMNSNGLRNSRIRAGQRLYIDKKVVKKTKSKAPKEKEASTKPKEASESVKNKMPLDVTYFFYTIKRGDTLWDIANAHAGVSLDQIKRMNTGVNFKRLNPGDKLRIPVT